MNVASVLDRKKQGPSGSLAGIRKPAALGGGCGGLRMKLRGTHFDRSITTNQSRSKDFSAATIRVPQCFYSRLPTKRAAYHPLEHLNQLVKDALVIVPSGLGRSDRPLAASPHVKTS
jgi:hypothetical protein